MPFCCPIGPYLFQVEMASLKLRRRQCWRRRYTTLLQIPGLRPLRRKPRGCIIPLPFCCPTAACLRPAPNPNRRDDELRLEIYHPPYLFRGPRPFIETVPQQIVYGGSFEIHSPQAEEIKWVELIWPMATTHSCETGQRVVDLEFKARDFCHLHVNVLSEQNIAPPGMVYAVSRQQTRRTFGGELGAVNGWGETGSRSCRNKTTYRYACDQQK